MLSWDEEPVAAQAPRMPELPKAMPQLQPVASASHFTAHHPETALNPELVTKPQAPQSTTGRVNATDKRIINGKTDVNQLVPFKYKWAW
ncbi:MAG: hypothetical protein RIR02_246, partial [Pseudomonadota bacterium]